jgi:hypothetical protein
MRRCVLLFLLALLGCSVPDDDASGRVRAWLESLDPDADVVEVRCTGNLEEPPGSGTWTEYERVDRWTAREVLGAFKIDGVDWAEVVARCISNSEYYLGAALLERGRFAHFTRRSLGRGGGSGEGTSPSA